MIFDLVYSSINGKPFARVPDFACTGEFDMGPFELVEMLRATFPERQYDFCVCCFGGYKNAVSL